MKVFSLTLVLVLFLLIGASSINQLNASKRIFCFTFIYFQSGDLYKEYLGTESSLLEKKRGELERQIVDQVEVCEELIEGINSEEELKGMYGNEEKLVGIIKGLRRVKQEHAMGNIGVSLSEKQQQIIRDFASYSVLFDKLQEEDSARKDQNEETGDQL